LQKFASSAATIAKGTLADTLSKLIQVYDIDPSDTM